jgi:hypothetical protein
LEPGNDNQFNPGVHHQRDHTSCPLYPGRLGLPSGAPPNQGVRADLAPGVSTSGPKTPGEFFNTAAFTQAVGYFGGAAPGAVLGPGFQRWDASLFKTIKFGERASLQLRLETFNTFNHGSPNFLVTNVIAHLWEGERISYSARGANRRKD